MKKTVTYKGENVKVNFVKGKFTKEVHQIATPLKSGFASGTREYIINGVTYLVRWSANHSKTVSIRLEFEGFTCGDSEKKMIEHIISKYGIISN